MILLRNIELACSTCWTLWGSEYNWHEFLLRFYLFIVFVLVFIHVFIILFRMETKIFVVIGSGAQWKPEVYWPLLIAVLTFPGPSSPNKPVHQHETVAGIILVHFFEYQSVWSNSGILDRLCLELIDIIYIKLNFFTTMTHKSFFHLFLDKNICIYIFIYTFIYLRIKLLECVITDLLTSVNFSLYAVPWMLFACNVTILLQSSAHIIVYKFYYLCEFVIIWLIWV